MNNHSTAPARPYVVLATCCLSLPVTRARQAVAMAFVRGPSPLPGSA